MTRRAEQLQRMLACTIMHGTQAAAAMDPLATPRRCAGQPHERATARGGNHRSHALSCRQNADSTAHQRGERSAWQELAGVGVKREVGDSLVLGQGDAKHSAWTGSI